MYEFSPTDTPKMVDANYKELYSDPCLADNENSGFKMIYYGTGIRRDSHPLKKRINMRGCGNPKCGSEHVKVIYAQWSVHPMSGDKYWDYEIFCEDCKKFTLRSYAEND